MIRAFRLLVFLLLAGQVAAQPQLLVDGQPAGLVDQATVPGVSYAAAHQLAAAVGARLEQLDGSVSLHLGASVLQLRVVTDPARALSEPDTVALDGRPAAGNAAVRDFSGTVLLPVKTVAEAFGGFVTVLSGTQDAVEVRLPQARLTSLTVSPGRISLELSAPVPYTVYYNEALSTVQISFRRTNPASLEPVTGTGGFPEAWLLTSAGRPELRIRLAEGSTYQLAADRAGSGWRLSVVVAGPVAQESFAAVTVPAAAPGQFTVLLDPAADRQLLDLALAVAAQLRDQGIEVQLTREEPDTTTVSLLAADRADLYLQLATAPSGLALHWLADAANAGSLQAAAELSAGDHAAVERLRRRLLLGEYAGRERAAVQAGPVSAELPAASSGGLPLTRLAVSLGHGLLLRIGADELSDPVLPSRLAAGIVLALELR